MKREMKDRVPIVRSRIRKMSFHIAIVSFGIFFFFFGIFLGNFFETRSFHLCPFALVKFYDPKIILP